MLLTDTCRRALRGTLLLWGLWSSAHAQADAFLPFTSTTLAGIKAEFAGRPFLLSLWSVTCAPCREDLAILSELRQQHPNLPLVLVSTDPIGEREAALWVLEEYGLHELPSWMFADSYAEPLRFSIDPAWYGELPRSYFFDATHTARAHSGVLGRELLDMSLPALLAAEPPVQTTTIAHRH